MYKKLFEIMEQIWDEDDINYCDEMLYGDQTLLREIRIACSFCFQFLFLIISSFYGKRWVSLFFLTEAVRLALEFAIIDYTLYYRVFMGQICVTSLPVAGAIRTLKDNGGFLFGPANIWFGLFFFSLCGIMLQGLIYIRQRRGGGIHMVPSIFAANSIAVFWLGWISDCKAAMFVSAGVFLYCLLVLLYPYLFRKRKGHLFHIGIFIPGVRYIQQCSSLFIPKIALSRKKRRKKKEFMEMSCQERKEVIKEEIKDLCGNLETGKLYYTETHEAFIRRVGQYLEEEGRGFLSVIQIGTFLKCGINSSFKKMYGDRWKKECQKCEMRRNVYGCSMTHPKLLDERFSRETNLWLFVVVENPKAKKK